MKRSISSARSLFVCLLAAALSISAPPGPRAASAVTMNSEIGSSLFTSTVSFPASRCAYVIAHMMVPVDVENVWAVLTDYENLTDYMPHLDKSEVIERGADRLMLRQEGSIWFPLKRFKTTAVIEIREDPPHVVAFKATEGDYQMYEGRWTLQATPEGTDLIYEALIEPSFWIPRCLLGALERKILKRTFEAVLSRASTRPGIRLAKR